MKNLTLILLFISSFTLLGQTTHNINWFIGASPGTLEIEEGDTVNWVWTDGAPHSVTSDPGSTDTFDSGILPSGSTFSRQFNDEGTNPYHCDVHPMMQGVIEVNPSLGIEDEIISELNFYPNPVVDYLKIESNELIVNAQLYDVNGRKLMDAPVQNKATTIYMGVFNDGVYFVTLNWETKKQTFRVVLQK